MIRNYSARKSKARFKEQRRAWKRIVKKYGRKNNRQIVLDFLDITWKEHCVIVKCIKKERELLCLKLKTPYPYL